MKLRKVERRLKARQASHEESSKRIKRGYKRPGSMNAHKNCWPLGKHKR